MRILVTAGPTREHLDPVRYLSNASSGRFGVEIARAAADRDHAVTLLHGPIDSAVLGRLPDAVERVPIVSTDDLSKAAHARFAAIDALFMVAAVADFTPIAFSDGKIKKTASDVQTFAFRKTEDILRGLGAAKTHQVLVGFNLETDGGHDEARRKLVAKNLDWIVANGPANLGSDTATVTVLDAGGVVGSWRDRPKHELASELVRLVEARIGGETNG